MNCEMFPMVIITNQLTVAKLFYFEYKSASNVRAANHALREPVSPLFSFKFSLRKLGGSSAFPTM